MPLNEMTKKQWASASQSCEKTSIYQDSRWLDLIEYVYPTIKIKRLIYKDENNNEQWLLPLMEIKPLGKIKPMLISLPFGNYGGFLIPKSIKNKGVEDNDLLSLKQYFENSHAFALEIRELTLPIHTMIQNTQFQRFEIYFPDSIDILWKKTISGNARTCVRKADKLGIKILFDHDEALSHFQSLYEINASYHGTPIHHVKWYPKLAEFFQDETEIILAEYEDKIIAAVLILHYQGKSILHTAVSNPVFRKIPATDRLLWSAFERIMERKKSVCFDFGRTRQDKGKQFFKKKWGGVSYTIYYSYFIKPGYEIPNILPDNPKFGQAINIYRRIPMSLKRFIGPFLRIRIPT